MSKDISISRRKFLKASGLTAGLAAVGGSFITAEAAQTHGQAPASEIPKNFIPKGRKFFTNMLEFNTVNEAAERIFPKDETGPGAKELSVAFFIDNQLAGAYGVNAREYTYGPYSEGAPTQGYQTPLLRKDIFLQGIAALNGTSREKYKQDFPDLTDDQKDAILKMCEKGELHTEGFKSSYFFSLLRTIVLAGVYADPIYAGNLNMAGWKMKNYPGARMSYSDIIESRKFEKIDPISLSDMI